MLMMLWCTLLNLTWQIGKLVDRSVKTHETEMQRENTMEKKKEHPRTENRGVVSDCVTYI